MAREGYFLQSISVDQCSLYLLCCIYVSPLGLLGQLGSLHQLVLLCHVACKIVLSSLNMSLFKGGGGRYPGAGTLTLAPALLTVPVPGQVPAGGRRPGHRVKLCVRLLAPGYLCVRGCSCQARVLVSLCSPVSAAAGLVSTVLQLLPSPATARPAPRTPLRGSKLIAATAPVGRPDRRVTAAHGDNRGSLLQYLHLHVGQYAVVELREQCDPNLTWKQNDV